MCGRFTMTVSSDEIARQFHASSANLPQLALNWNVSPTTPIYFVKGKNSSGDQREVAVAKWGLIPSWSKDASRASNAINARSESIAEKPSFREAFRSRRCIIPVSGYYEWATELGAFAPKQPFYIHNSNNSLLAIAGLYEYWIDPATNKEVTTASIITREAVGLLATIHHRAPVFLRENNWSEWVSTKKLHESEVDRYLHLLNAPDPTAGLAYHPVSTRVNSAAHHGADLIAPIELGAPETLF
jgi:putative SOS response-associated peptidase YedK